MGYPDGYQPAEHRRALDALLADVRAGHALRGKKAVDRLRSANGAAPQARVIGARAAAGHCDVVLRFTGTTHATTA